MTDKMSSFRVILIMKAESKASVRELIQEHSGKKTSIEIEDIELIADEGGKE